MKVRCAWCGRIIVDDYSGDKETKSVCLACHDTQMEILDLTEVK